jgi:hypothetical protein
MGAPILSILYIKESAVFLMTLANNETVRITYFVESFDGSLEIDVCAARGQISILGGPEFVCDSAFQKVA